MNHRSAGLLCGLQAIHDASGQELLREPLGTDELDDRITDFEREKFKHADNPSSRKRRELATGSGSFGRHDSTWVADSAPAASADHLR